jgi:hypothetical protein
MAEFAPNEASISTGTFPAGLTWLTVFVNAAPGSE